MVKCKDCVTEGIITQRSAPYPGPRCATHNRKFIKVQRIRKHSLYVQKNFGLSEGMYERLYAYQGGKCAICQISTGKTKRLAVDHSHAHCNGPTSCGQCVRGLLCSRCNSCLALARDDTAYFERALSYLNYSPFDRLRDETA